MELLPLIKNIRSSSAGIDGVHAKMIKSSCPFILPLLAILFDLLLSSSHFPAQWKRALIYPLAKKPRIESISDLRPIAKLSELSKLFEKAVHIQLNEFLEEHNIIHRRQTGFRRGHSTQTALLGVLEEVRHAIDDRKLTMLLLFDFSKAFDTVPHQLLIRKLHAVGCSQPALKWFFNYLTGRSQCTIDPAGNLSSWKTITTGVPQGSVLGPLLFKIFINDLPSVLTYSSSVIYADDTQIYNHFFFDDILSAIEKSSHDASAIANWAAANGLALNTGKTKVIILGSQAYTSRLDLATLPKVTVNGVPLIYANIVRNLGVSITPVLSWSDHVSFLLSKINRTLFSLRTYRHSLSPDLRQRLIETLIFPHFDYACIIYNDVDKTRELRLTRALNACVRFVHGSLARRDHVTPFRLQLGWLSPSRRRLFFIGLLAFKVLSNRSPSYLYNKFHLVSNIPSLRSSSRHLPRILYLPPPRTASLSASFVYTASNLLNSLPPFSLTPSPQSFNQFKESLRSFLKDLDRQDWDNRILLEGLVPLAHL